jgi:hypothetical protein
VVTVTVLPKWNSRHPTRRSVTITATVASDSSVDPNPGDNTVVETTELGVLRVAGGGLGCSTSASGSASGLSGVLAGVYCCRCLVFSGTVAEAKRTTKDPHEDY